MPNIVLILKDFGAQKVALLKAMRDTCGRSFSAIQDDVKNGRPVIHQPLFSRNDEEFPDKLLALLGLFEDLHVYYEAYEILEGHDFDENDRQRYFRVNHRNLANIIAARTQSIREQRELQYLEDSDQEI
ncbi:MAG: hypothetical protein U0791_06915 [Gemmataceae bacterium]